MRIVRKFPEIALPGKSKAETIPLLLHLMTVLSLLGLGLVLYMALVYAGTDTMQGNVQRIFYLHLGAFAGATVGFFAAVVGAIGYLWTRSNKWDALALAGIEVGLMLATITLITGMIWARPMWNTWWTWDPRLTSAAIMALTYAAYLMLRAGIENPDKKRVFASVYGILAISTLLFTTVNIRLRPDTIHPLVIGPSPQNAQGGFEMATSMGITLGISAIVFCCLLTPTLMWWRIRLENQFERIAHLRIETQEN